MVKEKGLKDKKRTHKKRSEATKRKQHDRKRIAGMRQKGKVGEAAQYLTRNRCLKKLQLSLKEFRRLCILKGIYPREPKKKIQGRNKTYYSTKDISFLAHEELLTKFRDISAFMKKIKKAKGRNDREAVKRLADVTPSYTLDHVVKERYPTFIDAVRDMDDSLTLVHLFASFPQTDKIEHKRITTCRRLSFEFQNYIVRARALRKVFLSIKGIYYQVDVFGQTVTWVTPWKFSQELPEDVDYRVMLTFLEFYEVMVNFINVKLYTSAGLRYPPKVDDKKDASDIGISAFVLELLPSATAEDTAVDTAPTAVQQKRSETRIRSLQKKIGSLGKANGHDSDDEGDDAPEGDSVAIEDTFANQQPDEERTDVVVGEVKPIFEGLKFFLAREVPNGALEFMIKSFGGEVGWEGQHSPYGESDEGITHQVVDRDSQRHVILSREYVQPQWVADCINTLVLIPVAPYAPGVVPPPHLSPWVNDAEEGYEPAQAAYLRSLQSSNSGVADDADDDIVVDDDDSDDEELPEDMEDLQAKESARQKSTHARDDDGDNDADSDEQEQTPVQKKRSAKKAKKEEAEAEAREQAKMMMPRKDARMFRTIQNNQAKKQATVERLEQKRKEIEKAGKKKGGARQ